MQYITLSSLKEGNLLKKDLLAVTLEKFKECNKTFLEISQETGLPYHWLTKLRWIKNPSVKRVQKLYEYLTGKDLV